MYHDFKKYNLTEHYCNFLAIFFLVFNVKTLKLWTLYLKMTNYNVLHLGNKSSLS